MHNGQFARVLVGVGRRAASCLADFHRVVIFFLLFVFSAVSYADKGTYQLFRVDTANGGTCSSCTMGWFQSHFDAIEAGKTKMHATRDGVTNKPLDFWYDSDSTYYYKSVDSKGAVHENWYRVTRVIVNQECHQVGFLPQVVQGYARWSTIGNRTGAYSCVVSPAPPDPACVPGEDRLAFRTQDGSVIYYPETGVRRVAATSYSSCVQSCLYEPDGLGNNGCFSYPNNPNLGWCNFTVKVFSPNPCSAGENDDFLVASTDGNPVVNGEPEPQPPVEPEPEPEPVDPGTGGGTDPGTGGGTDPGTGGGTDPGTGGGTGGTGGTGTVVQVNVSFPDKFLVDVGQPSEPFLNKSALGNEEFDFAKYFTWGTAWLPKSCPAPITVAELFGETFVFDFTLMCSLLVDYVAKLIRIFAIFAFLSIVLRSGKE